VDRLRRLGLDLPGDRLRRRHHAAAGLDGDALLGGLAAAPRVRRGAPGPGALRVTRRQACNAGVVGALLLLGGNGGVALAESADLPSGLAALLVAVIPLWVVLLRWLANDRPSARTVAGVALGLVGLAVLLLPGARPQGVALLALATVLGGSLLWSLGSFFATRADLPATG
jgi:drug/metabolite transporter (DMT)-like permease